MTGAVPATWMAVLGWTLIHFLWQGTAIALALAIGLAVLPRRAARIRYAAGCFALLLMLIGPAVTAWQLSDPSEPASPFFEPVQAASVVPERVEGTVPPATSKGDRLLSVETGTVPRIRSAGDSPRSNRDRLDPSALMPWIVAAWTLGVLICSVRLAGGWWQARRLVAIGTRPVAERWDRVKAELAVRLELSRPVRLLESSRVAVPIVVGWLKPTLLVPTAVLAGMHPQELEAVLAHELAHIRRHDYLVNLVQSSLETLLFYHPGVWWVSHVVRSEREHCCDDLAVAACGDPVLYARALTSIEVTRHHNPGLVLAISGSPLLARVRRLLGVREPVSTSSGWVVAVLTALMVSGAGVTGWLRLPEIAGSDVAAQQAATTPSAQGAPSAKRSEAPIVAAPDLEAVQRAVDEARRALEQAAENGSLDLAANQGALARRLADRQRALDDAVARVNKAAAGAAASADTRRVAEQSRLLAAEAARQARELVASAQEALQYANEAIQQAAVEAGRAPSAMSWGEWEVPPAPPAPAAPAAPVAAPVAALPWQQPAVPAAPAAPAVPSAPAVPASPASPRLWDGDQPPPPPAPPAPAAHPAPPAPLAPPAPAATPAPPAPPAPPRSQMNRDDNTWNMVSSHDGTTLKINAHGSIEFTDDDADVKSISRGGYLTISKSTGRFFGDTQSFEARETGGTIERKYNVNGKTLTGDEGRAWLRTFLPELLREMAINADRRVARMLAKGGPASVLELVSSVKGEYAKGVYMRELYAQAALDAPTLSRSLQQAGAEISSDYDLAQVLKTASEKQNIDATLSAFVEASRTIQSDYDLRGVLSRALARPSLTPSVASAIFKAAVPGPGGAGIDSDYDMAELLKDAPVSMVNQPGSGWAEAVGSISSAYDRHRAIAAVLRPGASPEIVEAALTSAAGLSSDYEAANLLIEIIKAGLLTDRTSHAFMSAASHIGSAYDRRRVMEAVARTSIGDAALAEAVGAAGRISSDYDRAESLIALGRAPGVGPSSRQALNDAASAIRSDYDRGRVLAALTKAR